MKIKTELRIAAVFIVMLAVMGVPVTASIIISQFSDNSGSGDNWLTGLFKLPGSFFGQTSGNNCVGTYKDCYSDSWGTIKQTFTVEVDGQLDKEISCTGNVPGITFGNCWNKEYNMRYSFSSNADQKKVYIIINDNIQCSENGCIGGIIIPVSGEYKLADYPAINIPAVSIVAWSKMNLPDGGFWWGWRRVNYGAISRPVVDIVSSDCSSDQYCPDVSYECGAELRCARYFTSCSYPGTTKIDYTKEKKEINGIFQCVSKPVICPPENLCPYGILDTGKDANGCIFNVCKDVSVIIQPPVIEQPSVIEQPPIPASKNIFDQIIEFFSGLWRLIMIGE